MMDSWILKAGDEPLGLLTFKEQDQPLVICHFQPEPAFTKYEPYFEEELRLLDLDDMDSWQEAYSAIDDFGLVLEPVKQEDEKITDFILHIKGDEAWFGR